MVPPCHTQQFTSKNCLALLILCLSIHALQRLTFPASDFLLFCMLLAQFCITNYFSFLRGLKEKVLELHGWAKRKIVLYWVSALLFLEVTCGIFCPNP